MACISTVARTTCGSSPTGGPSSSSSTSARCSTAAGRRRSSRRASCAADEWVVIPTGIAHGFLALDPLQLIYLVTNEYDGSDELGFAWDDPAVAVDWPPVAGTADGRPILSERDGANPPLAELVVRMRHEGP